ncbi:TolC family protein [Stieleria marina]|uniref:TolC family protein n=1 Tax=Stieleria marina TaxID=1930275 RepID=UPI003AF38F3B
MPDSRSRRRLHRVRVFRNRIQVAFENAKAQQELLQIAESRFASGDTPKLDVSQARANLANTHAAIPPLHNGLNQANNRLSLLIGATLQQFDATSTYGFVPSPQAQSSRACHATCCVVSLISAARSAKSPRRSL